MPNYNELMDKSYEDYMSEVVAKNAQRRMQNLSYRQLNVNAPQFSPEAETERQAGAVDSANMKQPNDASLDDSPVDTPEVHVTGTVPKQVDLGKYGHQFSYWDQMLAEEAKLSRALEDYDRQGASTSIDIQKAKTNLAQQLARVREQFVKDRDDMDLGVPYQEWHKARFDARPEPVAPEGPGLLSRIFQGVKDAGKFAIQHPLEAARSVDTGVKSLATLPFRAIESATTGGGEWPIMSPKRSLRTTEEERAQQMSAAGVDPRGTGPIVGKAVGEAILPVGPTLKGGQYLKNALKSGAFTGGAYATERVASDEPVDDAGLGASTGIGAGVGLLAGLLTKGKAKGVPHEPGPTAEGGSPTGGPGGPPKQIPYRDTTAGTVGPEGQFYGFEPPRRLPAPEERTPGHFEQMMAEVRTKGPKDLTPEEQHFLLNDQRRGPRNEPPNAGGTVEAIDSPLAVRTSRAAEEISERPASPPYPGSEYGMPGVKPPEPPATEGGLARVLGKGKPVAAKPLEPETLTTTKYTVEPLAKPEPKPAPAPEAVAAPVDDSIKKAEAELELGDILAGRKDVKEVAVERSPKSEALAPKKISDEVGAGAKPQVSEGIEVASIKPQPQPSEVVDFFGERPTSTPAIAPGKIAKTSKPSKVKEEYEKQLALGKTPEKARTLAEFKADQKLPEAEARPLEDIKLEDYLKSKGYTVREKEPFPGEKSYDVIDPQTGNVIARGDRASVLNAMQVKTQGKGFKLHSFPGDLGTFKETFEKALGKSGLAVGEGIERENAPATRSILNKAMQPFETPDFLMRKYAPGKAIVHETNWAERQISRRVNDLMYKPNEKMPGGYEPTKLFKYFEMDEAARAQVNKVLVLGDKRGVTFGDEALRKAGLDDVQVAAYKGVREALKDVRSWTKDASDLDVGSVEGYIPRVWHGQMEIFVDGAKHLKADGTSSFNTLREASAAAYEIKAAHPGAKVAIRNFVDPEYLGGRAFQDAQVISRIKANLERMGSASAADIDKAYAMGRDMKGFAKHLEVRKGEQGYETEGLDKVLFNYFHQAAKMVEMKHVRETVKNVIKDHARELTPDQVRYLQSYVERVGGKPTWDEVVVHDMIGSTGLGKWIDPVHGNKFLKDTRQLVNHLNLGLGNVSWALVNVDSLIRHAWPALQREARIGQLATKPAGMLDAEKYLMEGIQGFFTDKGLRQKLAHMNVVDIQHMSELRPQVGHKMGKGEWTPSRVSMALGTSTEEFVRSTTAIARYKMALDQGFAESDALRLAARFVDETSGRYSKAGKPAAFTGALGETLGMYKTYTSVFAQNAFKAFGGVKDDPGTFIRYMIATMGISGLLGLPGVKDLDDFITKHWGWSPIEAMQRQLPKGILTGIASVAPEAMGAPYLNVDLSAKAGAPDIIPNDTWSMLGPVVGRLGQTLVDLGKGEYKEAMIDMLPNSLKGPLSVLRGSDTGTVMGKYDKPSSRLAPGQEIPKVMGFATDTEMEERRRYERTANKEEYRQGRLKTLTHKLTQGTASEAEQEEFRSLGGSGRMLKNERQREQQTPRERQLRHLPKLLRRQEASSSYD
jgi:hypothetical protein